MFEDMTEKQARRKILSMVEEYANVFHKPKQKGANERIGYAGRVYDSEELYNLVDSSLDFWLTAGRYTEEFEHNFAAYLGVSHISIVNSGSSANLLAFMALTSPELGERSIKRGDEVITVAAGFPTTVSPIVQFGAIPVFIDITIPQYNVDIEQLEDALSDKTKAVIFAHTLGNPFDLSSVKSFCEKHDLWLIEDNCDALGATYVVDGKEVKTGTIGDIGTTSFYPAHQMTMGEGGAVYTSNELLHKLIRSYRDWGRDCVCVGAEDNHCGKRFNGQFGRLPFGYDHKYVYSHFGYNLKVTDMQAAIGCAQLQKLPSFIEKRRSNWETFKKELNVLSDKLILPERCPNSNPSWFGFAVTCRDGINATNVSKKIESQGIQTRRLFSGNMIAHPCFDAIRGTDLYRIAGNLINTDKVMHDTFWVGVYPGLTEIDVERMIDVIKGAVE